VAASLSTPWLAAESLAALRGRLCRHANGVRAVAAIFPRMARATKISSRVTGQPVVVCMQRERRHVCVRPGSYGFGSTGRRASQWRALRSQASPSAVSLKTTEPARRPTVSGASSNANTGPFALIGNRSPHSARANEPDEGRSMLVGTLAMIFTHPRYHRIGVPAPPHA
jgi:hypothetical protein